MKAERERTPYTQDMLGLCPALESIGPAKDSDTLRNCFINSNQDLMYRLRLTIKSSPTGLESRNRCRGRALSIRVGDRNDG